MSSPEKGQLFMYTTTLTLEQLWAEVGFRPNENQERAIKHIEGPLYLPAGPGSGKTRVLLWRTLNLMVFHDVRPEEIFLATFTEKAALQLREGLRALLGVVTNHTGLPYDLSKMYVGTVHSLCQRLIADRRFYANRQRGASLTLLDELGQYFFLRKKRLWNQLTLDGGFLGDANGQINAFFRTSSPSQHLAVTNCISLFNRLSEECIDPDGAMARTSNPILQALLRMYKSYIAALQPAGVAQRTDFSLLQQQALHVLARFPDANRIFKHVIVDEYQDTNTIQERLYFTLARGYGNLCVVGDDDQALYRFRGATVENFVEFPARSEQYLQTIPEKIPLAMNYRSREQIVRFYTTFITKCNWQKSETSAQYRVADKNIQAFSTDTRPAVVASRPGKPLDVCDEIAAFVRTLIDTRKVENANQIAFLFPSLKSENVQRMKHALEAEGLLVYAPRAGRFLEVDEAVAVFGLFMQVFGKPQRGAFPGYDYNTFFDWIDTIDAEAKKLLRADPQLTQFIADQRAELQRVVSDYRLLQAVVQRNGWDLTAPYQPGLMKRALSSTPGLTDAARRPLTSTYFERIVKQRAEEGRPMTLRYVINRATSVDWNVLDLFYRICGFGHFKAMFDLAQSGQDEGPICNLGLISQYLSRFMDEYVPILTADFLDGDRFQRVFFSSYLFALFRRGESEYEDADDPFPKGRIPFLTVHQSKGLEFPVVVLGNLRKDDKGPQHVEQVVQPLLDRQGEPLDRMTEFDTMRMFYVALSRAKHLLVLAHYKGQGQRINPPFQTMLTTSFPRIPNFDLATLPDAKLESDDLPQNYSYTGDYLMYQKCPRQYMIFRRYDFVPSRTQTMMFGNLVHRTLEDLHQFLIAQRTQP